MKICKFRPKTEQATEGLALWPSDEDCTHKPLVLISADTALQEFYIRQSLLKKTRNNSVGEARTTTIILSSQKP